MVREFQKIIGEETKEQILRMEGRLPDTLIACVGGGSNAIGLFYPFIKDESTEIIGVEAFKYLCANEGIILALESSHEIGYIIKLAPNMDKDKIIVVNLSGRGDKDVETISEYLNR